MSKHTTLRKRRHPSVPTYTHSSQVITDQAVTDAAALPTPNPLAVQAICEMIMEQQENVRRPPERSAALLALCVELHKKNLPFPSRMAAALKLDCSVFTIDSALSTRMDEGYLQQIVETTTGNVANRHSTVRQRFYKPSDELIDVVDRATKRLKK
jgi:hypothetical protein